LFWLVGFYPVLALLPLWARLLGGIPELGLSDVLPMRESLVQQGFFVALLGSVAYVGGTLPCGRFYYEGVEGFFGNAWLRVSYQYIFAYLGLWLHSLDRCERWVCALRRRAKAAAEEAAAGAAVAAAPETPGSVAPAPKEAVLGWGRSRGIPGRTPWLWGPWCW
jgi:hypothetical protein